MTFDLDIWRAGSSSKVKDVGAVDCLKSESEVTKTSIGAARDNACSTNTADLSVMVWRRYENLTRAQQLLRWATVWPL